MEYIPDGLTKKQWEEMKKKEEDALKNKNLGAVGITKFQSRSFEAWQKSGGKNLFPVDPSKPLEVKPYMQRPGGTPDGKDLAAKGLKGKDQAAAVKLTEIDKKYAGLEAEGKLKSTPFSFPWTNEATSKITTTNAAVTKTVATGVKKPTPAATPVKKGIVPTPPPVEEKKKGFFGLF